MIYLFIGLALLAVTGSIGWIRAEKKYLLHRQMYFNERNDHFDTKRKLKDVENRISELSNPPPPNEEAKEETEEQGNFVRMRRVRPATAETYRNVFDLTVDGQRILEDLTSQFCKPSYVRGGADAERESCYRAGQGSVVNRILAKINTANDPNYKEEQDND